MVAEAARVSCPDSACSQRFQHELDAAGEALPRRILQPARQECAFARGAVDLVTSLQ